MNRLQAIKTIRENLARGGISIGSVILPKINTQ